MILTGLLEELGFELDEEQTDFESWFHALGGGKEIGRILGEKGSWRRATGESEEGCRKQVGSLILLFSRVCSFFDKARLAGECDPLLKI